MISRHRYLCSVRFSDVDIYGHVNNVKYFEYYQEARLSFLSSLDPERDLSTWRLVVARVDVDYRRPMLFRPEPYRVESWVTRVGRSSFRLRAEITDADVLYSAADAVLVTFDDARQQSRHLSEAERERLLAVLTQEPLS